MSSTPKPLALRADEVRALLDTGETTIRRDTGERERIGYPHDEIVSADARGFRTVSLEFNWTCPLGTPGEVRWVRETFQFEDVSEYDPEHAEPAEGPVHLLNAGEDNERLLIPRYRATAPDTLLEIVEHDGGDPREGMRWRSPISMPRWASRLTVQVTALDVERIEGTWRWAVGLRRCA